MIVAAFWLASFLNKSHEDAVKHLQAACMGQAENTVIYASDRRNGTSISQSS